MTYYLFKLQFTAPVHFGDSFSAVSLSSSEMTFCADRLFSALCQTAVRQGDRGVELLYNLVQSRQLRFSDAFPWKGEQLYLPRPCLEAKTVRDTDAADRKAMKKVAYISIHQYTYFLQSLSDGDPIDPKTLLTRFGEASVVTRAAIMEGKDALPYAVGQYRFDTACGLYFLAALAKDDLFRPLFQLVRQLGLGGIGGKVSSGYGSFVVERACPVRALDEMQASFLLNALDMPDADLWISLTTSLPKEEELDAALHGALYQIVRRAGFVQTTNLKGPEKKKEQFFLAAGSTFRHPYRGDVYDVAPENCPHPVYRYAVPLFLGVKKHD